MNNRIDNINRVLQDLYISAIDNKISLTQGAVYHYLTGRSASNVQEQNKVRNGKFNKWINRFRGMKNINVFVAPNWKYFCQFTNNKGNKNPLECIKLYIPLDYNHIEEGANRIFDFLEMNNIKHSSKISSDVRTDDIVVRLYDKIDAMKLQDFVSKDRYIKEGMLQVNPFCFNKDGVGYAYDNRSSYNSYVSSLVADYINMAKANNFAINNVNVNDFYNYVNSVSHDLVKNFSLLKDKMKTDLYLTDACVMSDLLKLSLKSNSMNDYYNFYDRVRDKNYRTKLEQNVRYGYRKQLVRNTAEVIMASYNNGNNMLEDKEMLFKEFVLTTMKKYPLGFDSSKPNLSGWDYIIDYVNGNNIAVTRDKNLRERVNKNLSRDDIYNIVDKSDIIGNNIGNKFNNYIKKIMLDDIIKSMENKYPNNYINNLRAFLVEDDLKYITSNGKARFLAKTMRAGDIRRFMFDIGVNDIEEYINKYYNVEENRRMKR